MQHTEAFLATVYPVINKVAKRVCRGNHMQDDAVQECLIELLKTEPPENLEAWATVVLRNKYRSLIRKAGNDEGGSYERMKNVVLGESTCIPDFVRDANLIISTMSGDLGAVAEKYFVGNQSMTEISKALDMSYGRVRGLVEQGRGILHTMLSEYVTKRTV